MNFFYKCNKCPPRGIYNPGFTYQFALVVSGHYTGRDDWDQQYSFTQQEMDTYFENTTYSILQSAILPASSPLLGGPPNSTIKDPDIKAPQVQTEIVAEYVAERTPYDDYMERFCLDEY